MVQTKMSRSDGQARFDFTPADLDEKVLARLLPGRCNARHSKDIAAELGVSDRRVRNSFSRLVLNRGIMIGSASSQPAGTFLAVTEEELADASRELFGRALVIMARGAKLRKASLSMVFRQACLAFDVDPDEADIGLVLKKIKAKEVPHVLDPQ
jgi:hypothetical protein